MQLANLLNLLDRVFEVVFARYRRALGDSNVSSAWRRASNKVSAYVAWPVLATVGTLTIAIYSMAGIGTPTEHKGTGQVIAVIAGIATAMLLDRRFRKYLMKPPVLATEESNSEARLVFWFHACAIGIFALAGCVFALLHVAGFNFR